MIGRRKESVEFLLGAPQLVPMETAWRYPHLQQVDLSVARTRNGVRRRCQAFSGDPRACSHRPGKTGSRLFPELHATETRKPPHGWEPVQTPKRAKASIFESASGLEQDSNLEVRIFQSTVCLQVFSGRFD